MDEPSRSFCLHEANAAENKKRVPTGLTVR